MNPSDEKLLELLTKLLPLPGEEEIDKAIQNMEWQVKKFLEKFKEKMVSSDSVDHMQSAANCVRAFAQRDADILIHTMLSAFFAQALYACAFNKTMPEALKLYGDMLRRQAK